MTIYSFARWLRAIKNLSEEEIDKCWRDAEAYEELCKEYEEYKNGEEQNDENADAEKDASI